MPSSGDARRPRPTGRPVGRSPGTGPGAACPWSWSRPSPRRSLLVASSSRSRCAPHPTGRPARGERAARMAVEMPRSGGRRGQCRCRASAPTDPSPRRINGEGRGRRVGRRPAPPRRGAVAVADGHEPGPLTCTCAWEPPRDDASRMPVVGDGESPGSRIVAVIPPSHLPAVAPGSGSPVTVARPRRILTGFLARRAGRSQGSRSRAGGQSGTPRRPGGDAAPGRRGDGRGLEVGGVGDRSGGARRCRHRGAPARPSAAVPPDRRRGAAAPLEGLGRGPQADALEVEGAEDPAQELALHAGGRRRPPQLVEPLWGLPDRLRRRPAGDDPGSGHEPVPEATAAVGVRAHGGGGTGGVTCSGGRRTFGWDGGRTGCRRLAPRSLDHAAGAVSPPVVAPPVAAPELGAGVLRVIEPWAAAGAVHDRAGVAGPSAHAWGWPRPPSKRGEGCRPLANRHGQMATNVQLSLSEMCSLAADRHPVCAQHVVCDSILLGSPSSATLLQHKAPA
jgi:hypothetical protein